MNEGLRSGLSSGYVEFLQQQQTAVASEVGKKCDQGERLMRRLIPMAHVGRSLSRQRMRVDDGRAAHSLAINDAEVGAVFTDGGSWTATNRTDEDRIGVLQIVEPQVARQRAFRRSDETAKSKDKTIALVEGSGYIHTMQTIARRLQVNTMTRSRRCVTT